MFEAMLVLLVMFVGYRFSVGDKAYASMQQPVASQVDKASPAIQSKVVSQAALSTTLPKYSKIKANKINTQPLQTTPKASVAPSKSVKAAKKSVAVIPAEKKSAPAKAQIKNPLTGELTTSLGQYRFAKRWVKEALVAEGLLDKVYKNADLTPALEKHIAVALEQLMGLEKYQA